MGKKGLVNTHESLHPSGTCDFGFLSIKDGPGASPAHIHSAPRPVFPCPKTKFGDGGGGALIIRNAAILILSPCQAHLLKCHTRFVANSNHKAIVVQRALGVQGHQTKRHRCPTSFLKHEDTTDSLPAALSKVQSEGDEWWFATQDYIHKCRYKLK